MSKLGGTLTRRKKSVPPEEREHSQPPTNQPNEPPVNKERREEDEAEKLEREGQDALECCLILPQPDLKQLEDGRLRFWDFFELLGHSSS